MYKAIIIVTLLAPLTHVAFPVGEGISGAYQAVIVYAHHGRDMMFPQDRKDGHREAVEHEVYMCDIWFLFYD